MKSLSEIGKKMSDKEKLENKEYKKRIEKMIAKIEKEKEFPEDYQRLLEAMEKLKQTAIFNINPTYRNDMSVLGFIALIGGYFSFRKDPNFPSEENQFQEEIDFLYDLIYQEMKKTNLLLFKFNQAEREHLDVIHKIRIIKTMKRFLGEQNVNQFYNEFNIQELLGEKVNEAIKAQQKFDTKMGLIIGIPLILVIVLVGLGAFINFYYIASIILFLLTIIFIGLTKSSSKDIK